MFPPYGGVGQFGVYGNAGLFGALVSYGTLNLTVTSPQQSFVEPITLAQAKSFLRLPPVSAAYSTQDDDITDMIVAARVQAELLQNRDLVVKQYDLSHDYWPGYYVELRAPVRSVDLVQYRDSNGAVHTMNVGTDYVVDLSKHPGSIVPPYNVVTWPVFMPWPSSAILVRFSSGMTRTDPFWSDTGAQVKMGMRQLISSWYSNRLPFERGISADTEYPYAITACLSYGALPRVR